MHCKPTWFGIQCFVPINPQLSSAQIKLNPQFSSKLISHKSLVSDQTHLHWSPNQSKNNNIQLTRVLQSHRNRNPMEKRSVCFVKIVMRAPSLLDCGAKMQICERLLFADNSKINWDLWNTSSFLPADFTLVEIIHRGDYKVEIVYKQEESLTGKTTTFSFIGRRPMISQLVQS